MAGSSIELAWSVPPRGARELEVLLSVDDGAHFTLRATAEIDGALGRARWRVPNLPTAHARLRLRWSDGTSETLAPVTPAFRIVAPSVRAAGVTPASEVAVVPSAAPAWDEADPATAGPLADALPGLTPDGTLASGGDGGGADFTAPRTPSARTVEPCVAVGVDVRPAACAARATTALAPLQRRAPLRE